MISFSFCTIELIKNINSVSINHSSLLVPKITNEHCLFLVKQTSFYFHDHTQ